MKVVHLATTDLGGSYKAVERIHKGLLLNGVDSKVLLRTKYHEDSVGEEVIHTPLQKLVSKVKNVGNLLCSQGEIITDRFGTDMRKHPDVQSADVIILHWINSFISDKGVAQLVATGKPVIMVAHDMWCCTGGCHCDAYCGRYVNGCGNCPQLDSKADGENVKKDLSWKNFNKKKALFSGVTLITPSSWSAEVAENSAIWQGHEIFTVLNPIDTDRFRKINVIDNAGRPEEGTACKAAGLENSVKHALRDKYGIPKNKKVILYGAAITLTDKNKGAQNISAILSGIDVEEYQLVVFGNKDGEQIEHCPLDVTYLGYIRGEDSLCEVYNLADVFLVPSEQESFCYTVGEALLCNIPVVAYAIGGIKDQVRHKKTGYLAEYGKIRELAEGIRYCTQHEMGAFDGNGNSLVESGRKYAQLCENLVKECKLALDVV